MHWSHGSCCRGEVQVLSRTRRGIRVGDVDAVVAVVAVVVGREPIGIYWFLSGQFYFHSFT